ATIGTAMYK
nr:Chain C, ALA-THR-ILE-GLY-THR-ALA-MET-TYR-LYS [synthetic construct]